LKKTLLFIILLYSSFVCVAQKKYWQQQTDYHITVTLNDVDNSLTGYEEILYTNNAPDTLFFIWIHVWPNAYKNDHTAFSDQMLENGSTAFYFSEENKKGYINKLSFKVDNVNAYTEDHPQHQDIIKLVLPQPIAPGKQVKIETPFHVKLPYNFSRGGHIEQSYQITQWYPKPAVYDKQGWHEMPYLNQGEFYSEFGSFDVKITLPENYVVAATGILQNEEEKNWLKNYSTKEIFNEPKKNNSSFKTFIPSSSSTKTLHYIQADIHDFAWFADKSFLVQYDTIKLSSGRVIDAYSFVLPTNKNIWKNSLSFTKKSILSKSNWIGEYPYNAVSVVDNAAPTGGGMEYPMVTLLTANNNEKELERVINHEIGHNWFYGILATNERQYPWIDEGMNSYYDKRYVSTYSTFKNDTIKNSFEKKIDFENAPEKVLETAINFKRDQAINTISEDFSEFNYGLIVYVKSSLWMQKLEQKLGTEVFDKAMQAYFTAWKFKHPQPEDFKSIIEKLSAQNVDSLFSLLNKKGSLENKQPKKIKFTGFFNTEKNNKYNYIGLMPTLGYNLYDKFMIGATLHNYNLPPNKFQFFVTPLYATGTKKMNGTARAEYTWVTNDIGNKLCVSLAASKFTGGSFKDSTGTKNPLQFSKIVPSIKYEIANSNPRSKIKKIIQWKTFFINETNILFTRDIVNNKDIITYPKEQRYVNQLQIGIRNSRALYPYDGIFQAEQGEGFVRLNFTGNYYFNYAKAGGLNVRIFAGKFIYTGEKNFIAQYKTSQYHLNMTGAKGDEDYTYSNYFIGRNEFEGFATQQIANKDGFFKVRTDLLSSKVGRTDDWLAAANLVTDIPESVNIFNALPIKIPVRLFIDVGTYAEAWKKNSATGRLLYDAGFQISLFKNVVNIYVPLVYSKVYGDYFKSTIPEKRFQKNIAFTIDVQQLKVSKLFPQLNF
jgi:Peptidase family M1 domain